MEWVELRYRGYVTSGMTSVLSHRPVEPLACPARFERATYALEAGKMSKNNSLNNTFKVFRSGVQ